MTLMDEIEVHLAREHLGTAWDEVTEGRDRWFTNLEWANAHAEAGDGLWDPPLNESSPRELEQYIEGKTNSVLEQIEVANRPDETGLTWGARFFYAIARTLGWDTAQAILGTPAWSDEP
jgi:hypothetical protein